MVRLVGIGLVLLVNLNYVSSVSEDTELDFDGNGEQGWADDGFMEELLNNPDHYFDAFEAKECKEACASLGYYEESYSCLDTCQSYKDQIGEDFMDEDGYDQEEYDLEERDEFELDEDIYDLYDYDEDFFEDDTGDL